MIHRGSISAGICPSINISAEALFQRAALCRASTCGNRRRHGQNTVNAMQSGLFFGYVGVDGLVRIRAELPAAPTQW